MNEEWSFNEINNEYWNKGTFETEKEAKAEAIKYAREKGYKKIAIGKCEPVPLRTDMDAEVILEYLEELYSNDCGSEYKESLYDEVPEEEREWLERKLQELLEKFNKKAGIKSNWFTVIDTKEIDIKQTSREKLFKGKRIYNGEWIVGFYVEIKGESFLFVEGKPCEKYEVYPETVCEYTGKTDKNGVKIFEHDKVRYPDYLLLISGETESYTNEGYVEYDPETLSYFFTERNVIEMGDIDISSEVEVIGNKYD